MASAHGFALGHFDPGPHQTIFRRPRLWVSSIKPFSADVTGLRPIWDYVAPAWLLAKDLLRQRRRQLAALQGVARPLQWRGHITGRHRAGSANLKRAEVGFLPQRHTLVPANSGSQRPADEQPQS